MPRKPGWTQDIEHTLFGYLEKGATLEEATRHEGMPAHSTVWRWMESVEGFKDRYRKAREIGYRNMADEIKKIADETDSSNPQEVAKARLRIETRKWLMAKALPKVYGDKVTHQGDSENPVQVAVEVTFVD